MQNDETVVPEQATETPPEQFEQAQTSAEVDQRTDTGENAQQADATQQEQPKADKSDWVQRRIDQLTREKYEERRAREALEARLRELQPPAESGQRENAQPMTADQIKAEARRIVQQEKFDAACNKTFEAGKKEFPDFEKVLPRLGLFGGFPPDLLSEITSMDDGHKVLKHLADNPDVGESLVNLPPLRQARELARIESVVAQAKSNPVSKAPPPINPVGGRSAPVEPAEFATTAEQIAWWKKHGSN